jgi:hypothetical protein
VLTTEIFSHADNLIRNATAVELERFFLLPQLFKIAGIREGKKCSLRFDRHSKANRYRPLLLAMALRTPAMTNSAQFRR